MSLPLQAQIDHLIIFLLKATELSFDKKIPVVRKPYLSASIHQEITQFKNDALSTLEIAGLRR